MENDEMTNDAAVAWRVRIGDSHTWGFTSDEDDADFHGKNSGLPYVKEALVPATTVAELRAEVERLTQALHIETHKVITCGVAASHPDASLSRRMEYGGAWDSPQAQEVRVLRERAEAADRRVAEAEQKLAEVLEAAIDFLEAADARDNEEVSTQYPDHDKRLRQYKAAREDLNAILPGPTP